MFKIFKYCLELHRQNICYEKALWELFLMILRRDANRTFQEFDLPKDSIIHSLPMEIRRLLKEKEQQPADNGNNTGKSR
jgi:hypothetical protein